MSINDYVDDLEVAAQGFAQRAKAVVACPAHDDVLVNQFDDDADRMAYAMATNALKRGDLAFDREELMAAIKDVIVMSADECPECEANARD